MPRPHPATPRNPLVGPESGGATASTPRTYVVKAGDNLTRIAARTLGSGERWDEIFAANRDQLASPDALVTGQTLRLPVGACQS